MKEERFCPTTDVVLQLELGLGGCGREGLLPSLAETLKSKWVISVQLGAYPLTVAYTVVSDCRPASSLTQAHPLHSGLSVFSSVKWGQLWHLPCTLAVRITQVYGV